LAGKSHIVDLNQALDTRLDEAANTLPNLKGTARVVPELFHISDPCLSLAYLQTKALGEGP
jgi:hypothetical protein